RSTWCADPGAPQRPRGPLACLPEASGHLVGPPVFNTGVTQHLGQVGSIPIRLRQAPRRAKGQALADQDPRRTVPRTDAMLADARLRAAATRLGAPVVRRAVATAQERVRSGAVAAADATEHAVGLLPESPSSIEPV